MYNRLYVISSTYGWSQRSCNSKMPENCYYTTQAVSTLQTPKRWRRWCNLSKLISRDKVVDRFIIIFAMIYNEKESIYHWEIINGMPIGQVQMGTQPDPVLFEVNSVVDW